MLIQFGTLLFIALLNRTGAPGWIQTLPLAGGAAVWHRYRWKSCGRERMADGLLEVAEKLDQHRSNDGIGNRNAGDRADRTDSPG